MHLQWTAQRWESVPVHEVDHQRRCWSARLTTSRSIDGCETGGGNGGGATPAVGVAAAAHRGRRIAHGGDRYDKPTMAVLLTISLAE